MRVEQECPQCGAPVILDETDRFLSCNYCRVQLYCTTNDYFRYCLASRSHASEEIIYVPYWRFRGMHYVLKAFRVRSKVLDTSFIAVEHKLLPSSLGVRTQALKLRFASSGTGSRFLCTQVSFRQVFSRIENSSSHQAFIGELTSIVYAPIYLNQNEVFDAVLNRPIAQRTRFMPDNLHYQDSHHAWNVHFISAQCPDCGWDLIGGKKSVLLLCRDCDSVWQPSGDTFRKLNFGVIPTSENDVYYMPFWRLKVLVEGVALESFGDLIKLANLPRAMTSASYEKELFFWSPAFTGNPAVFLRLAKQLTLHQPGANVRDTLPRTCLSPVTINLSEALESVKITLAHLAVAKKNVFSILPDLEIKLQNALLVFLPFHERGSEFIQAQMNISIQRTAVRGL